MKKILIVITSHAALLDTDTKTGMWLGEFTDPYYAFKDAGLKMTLASPKGGKPPVDPMSELTENITDTNRRFNDDQEAQQAFANTHMLSDMKAEDFDAIFFPGGHGPMFDLATDQTSGTLICDFYRQHKPIAAVCHGPAALLEAARQLPEILQNKNVTAFSNTEEALVFKKDHIPFLLEDELKRYGAKYHSSTIPFTATVQTDGLLITGQNPASSNGVAEALINKLEEIPAAVV